MVTLSWFASRLLGLSTFLVIFILPLGKLPTFLHHSLLLKFFFCHAKVIMVEIMIHLSLNVSRDGRIWSGSLGSRWRVLFYIEIHGNTLILSRGSGKTWYWFRWIIIYSSVIWNFWLIIIILNRFSGFFVVLKWRFLWLRFSVFVLNILGLILRFDRLVTVVISRLCLIFLIN